MLKLSRTIREAPMIDDCAAGQHRPRRGSEYLDGGNRRATCRGCRCALVRVDTTRRWIHSGLLG